MGWRQQGSWVFRVTANQESLAMWGRASVAHQLLELAQTHVHPTISSSVVPFSSYSQYFPASGSFQISQFFTSGGQSIGVSASASVLPMNIQDWFPLGLTGFISLQSKGPQESSPTPQFKSISSSVFSFLMVQLSHPHMTTGKIIALTRQTFVNKIMSLLLICSLGWA